MSRLILLHGFTQTGASWDHLRLDARQPDIAPASLWESAAAVASEGPGVFVGYSMGGRIALHVALGHRDVVEGLVLVSTTAGIEDAEEREARRASDEALAARIESIGADEFLDEWLAQPMFAGVPPAGREGRVADAGALAASLRLAGTGTQEPLWDRLPEIDVPALVIAGAQDTKYVALAERLAGELPRAEVAVIPNAGHAVHLERPDAFVAVLRAWMEKRAN